MTTENDYIGKIEHLGGVKHCEIFLFMPLFLSDNNITKISAVVILITSNNISLQLYNKKRSCIFGFEYTTFIIIILITLMVL